MVETKPSLDGTVLNSSYRLLRTVGEGGMGAVYEAIQLRLNQRVAVKLLTREMASNQQAFTRFRREAEITSALGHPHIVHVTDFGLAPGGEPYLVMEFLEGEDLEDRLDRVGRLPLAHALHIVRQVASALAATHLKGIVHRDLKPANIYLVNAAGETDFVKVLDFGISKVQTSTTRLTQVRMTMGTPRYMSPEQARGKMDLLDHRADQWALACITWQMLAGEAPFQGDDVNAVLYQVCHEEPPSLLSRVPGLPREVETVLRRAMAKSHVERFHSIGEFAHALRCAALGIAPQDLTPVPEPSITGVELLDGTVPWSDKLITSSGLSDEALRNLSAAGLPRATARRRRAMLVAGGAFALLFGAGLALPGLLASKSAPPVPVPAPPPHSHVAAPVPAPAPVVESPPEPASPAPAPPPRIKARKKTGTTFARAAGEPSVSPAKNSASAPALDKPSVPAARPSRQLIKDL